MATEYEVSISCRNLANKDVLSKSDPVAILLEREPQTGNFVELGRTELVMDCLNPDFATKFRLKKSPNQPEAVLRVMLIDIDDFGDMGRLDKHDHLGQVDIRRSQLFANPTFSVPLSGNPGHVIFKTVRYDASLDGRVILQVANHDFPLKNRPIFLEIRRSDKPACDMAIDDDDFTLVYRSEQSATGDFEPIELPMFSLALGQTDRPLRLQVWRFGQNGGHVLLGRRNTSLAELQKLSGESCKLLDFQNCKSRNGQQQFSLAIKKVEVSTKLKLATNYEVSISCKNLAKKDLLTDSDPVIILLEKDAQTGIYAELGRTELVKNTLNPSFAKKFCLQQQHSVPDADATLRVLAVDIDDFDDIEKIDKQDYIGDADFQLSQLIANPTFTVTLSDNSSQVIFKTVRYDESLDGLVALGLQVRDARLKGQPIFLEIYRSDKDAASLMDGGEEGDFTLVYRSKQLVNDEFEPISVSLFTLTLGDRRRNLRLELWRLSSDGKEYRRLGVRDTRLSELEHLNALGYEPRLDFKCCGADSVQPFRLLPINCHVVPGYLLKGL